MRLRLLPALAAVVLGAATAMLVACGGDGRIPAGDASSLTNALNEVSVDFRAGRCDAAERAVAKAQNELLALPDSVDAALRNRLQSGIRNLRTQVPKTCDQAQTQTQQTQTDTTTTDTTTTDTGTTDTGTTGTDTGTTGTDTGTTGTTGTTTGTGTTTPTTTGTDTGTGGTPPGGDTTP
jgi:hypothetical protein